MHGGNGGFRVVAPTARRETVVAVGDDDGAPVRVEEELRGIEPQSAGRVERPGDASRYLDDTHVRDRADMRAQVTFFAGDRQLGDPLEVPFVRDC